ncbi:MAG: peptidoglycan-binding protein [Thermoanaerobaculia bacterium]|nr:peptidoglycan-binding protein [Thermoanaerobaculia bacterium]
MPTGSLNSKLFAIPFDSSLEACAISDPAHISLRENNSGAHVAKIQQALNDLEGVSLASEKGRYGTNTADAISDYKQKRNIFNFEGKIDKIVGKQTIKRLDADMVEFERLGGGGRLLDQPGTKQFVFAPFNGPFRIKFGPDDRAKSDLGDQPSNSAAATFAKRQLRIARQVKLGRLPLDLPPDPTKDECEAALLSTIGRGGSDAREMATFLFNNRLRTGLRTFADGTFWPNQVKKDPSFTANNTDLSAKIRESLQELANRNRTASGVAVDVNLLREGGTQPQPLKNQVTKIDFSGLGFNTRIAFGNPLAFGFGSIQGVDIRMTSFSGDARTGTYQGLLIYRIIDHFGADDSVKDATGEGQAGLFLLQRGMATGQDKSRYKPYVSEVIAANVAFSGQLT